MTTKTSLWVLGVAAACLVAIALIDQALSASTNDDRVTRHAGTSRSRSSSRHITEMMLLNTTRDFSQCPLYVKLQSDAQ